MRSWKVLALVAVLGLLTASVAQAATYQLKLNVYSLDASFNPRVFYTPSGPISTVLIESPDPGAAYYMIDVYISFSNPASYMRGFGNMKFNVLYGPGVSDSGLGWIPDASQVDSNGLGPLGKVNLWEINKDAGPSETDLREIIVSITTIEDPNAADPRPWVGQPLGPTPYNVSGVINGTNWPDGNTYIGSLLFQWDGSIPADGVLVCLDMTQASFASNTVISNWPGQPGTYPPGKLFVDWTGTLIDGMIVVPEPASMALLALAGLVLLPRRK